jgi:hypothetical protein
MGKQTSSENPLDIVPLWMKISLWTLCSFVAIVGIWRHGLKSWDWAICLPVLGILLFPMGGRNARWPLRTAFLLWVTACSAWVVHFWGWVPALACFGIALLSPNKEKFVGWKAYFQKPQNIINALLTLILMIWFARATGGWVPLACAALTSLLLEGYTTARRSLRDNLRRRSFAALAAVATVAAVWALLHPSFMNVAGVVLVVALVSSDVYFHTEGEPTIRISQSQT